MNSIKNISVDAALKKGVRWINIPCYTLMFSFFLLFPAILLNFYKDDSNNIFLIIGCISCIILAFVSPFIWYSLTVVKYKIWASKNVKDIHRFYNEAISKKIINDSNFFRKLEIKSKNQRTELNKFYERLGSERVLVRDYNVEIESETLFKANHNFNVFLYVAFTIFSIYLYFSNYSNNKRSILLIGFVSLGLLIYEVYKKNKYNYILKINRDFIAYKDEEIKIYWKDVLKYDTSVRYSSTSGKFNAKFSLNIITNDKNYELPLEGIYKIGVNKIITVLNENKHRFDVKNQSMK